MILTCKQCQKAFEYYGEARKNVRKFCDSCIALRKKSSHSRECQCCGTPIGYANQFCRKCNKDNIEHEMKTGHLKGGFGDYADQLV